ncbi:MAG: hypothetical protein HOW73_11055 [Polyangiaceae bacterium]|nr:hypothetical protein [Polyangiaceae bacterium]
MFSPAARLLATLFAIIGGVTYAMRGSSAGWLLVAAGLLVGSGYFRYGTVWSAFRAYQRGDVGTTAQRLAQTRYPALLTAESRAYFEFLTGAVQLRRGDPGVARSHLEIAARGPLRTENMQCIVQCHLAEAALELGEHNRALDYLAAARKLPHTDALEEIIGRLETKSAEGRSTRRDGSP